MISASDRHLSLLAFCRGWRGRRRLDVSQERCCCLVQCTLYAYITFTIMKLFIVPYNGMTEKNKKNDQELTDAAA